MPVWISTVWLGLDHNFGRLYDDGDQRPWIFETMAFLNHDRGEDFVCLRYATWEEAEVGHKMIAELLKKGALRPARAGGARGLMSYPEHDENHEPRWKPSKRGFVCTTCLRRREEAYGRCPYKTCREVRDVIEIEGRNGHTKLKLICPGCGREQ